MLAYFTIRLICGIALMLCLMPRRDVATPFFRILMLVLLGMNVLGALTTSGPRHWLIAAAAVSFAGSTLWLLERRRAGTGAIQLVAGLSLCEFWGEATRLAASEHASQWLVAASGLASAGTLGAAMTGMLLGHRYLTAPGMPLAPLQRLNGVLGGAAALRTVVSAYGLLTGAGLIATEVQATWLALRWLAGIIGPLVVCVMVWRILKYRNTQSATGVLFVGVILTFIGELAADLLFHDLHVPY
jgi:hypothetical protein